MSAIYRLTIGDNAPVAVDVATLAIYGPDHLAIVSTNRSERHHRLSAISELALEVGQPVRLQDVRVRR